MECFLFHREMDELQQKVMESENQLDEIRKVCAKQRCK